MWKPENNLNINIFYYLKIYGPFFQRDEESKTWYMGVGGQRKGKSKIYVIILQSPKLKSNEKDSHKDVRSDMTKAWSLLKT